MRGDRPYTHPVEYFKMKFTPHARGSTPSLLQISTMPCVYPACAGIDRYLKKCACGCLSLPRMRGDRPVQRSRCSMSSCVYPACAGIDLCSDDRNPRQPCLPRMRGIDPRINGEGSFPLRLPRMRGDRPSARAASASFFVFTPHARGSTQIRTACCIPTRVYPACAGIDPTTCATTFSTFCLPRMRGDRPLGER